MQKKIRRATGILMATVIAASSVPAAAEEQTEPGVMGRYLEEDVSLPEDVFQIFDIEIQNDGSVKALVSGGEGVEVLASEDQGETWEVVMETPGELKTAENFYAYVGAMGEDGTFFVYMGGSDGGYFRCDPQGNITEVPLAFITEEIYPGEMDFLQEAYYLEEGRIVGRNLTSDKFYLFDDQTGEVIRTYNDEEEWFSFWTLVGDRIVAISDEKQVMFDTETGERTDIDGTLKDALTANPEYLMSNVSGQYPIIMTGGQEEECLYYCTEKGLYRYVEGGSLTEQLIDGSLNSIGNPAIGLQRIVKLADQIFLLSVKDSEGKSQLLRYAYSPDTPAVPDKEITVYSLKENDGVRQAIALFQKKNPDYIVRLEVGMTGEDAVTAADALRTLNTDILAGEGPDILILDGMPVDAYMEKGILTDISGLLEEISQTETFYEAVKNCYERDGKMYAVPSRFTVPMLQGEKEIVEQIHSLTDLADAAESLRAQDSEAPYIIYSGDIYWMMKRIYGAYAPNFLLEDGSLNREAVTEFVTQLKRIYDTGTPREGEEWFFSSNVVQTYDFSGIGLYLMDFALGNIKLATGNLDGITYGFMEANSVDQHYGTETVLMDLSEGNVYIPATILGISSKSSHIQDAESFVRFMLAEEMQMSEYGGLPVNKGALEKTLQKVHDDHEDGTVISHGVSEEGGEMIELDVNISKPEEDAALMEQLDSVDTPSPSNEVMEELILEQTGNCLAGQMTEEEAVNSIVQKMELYLTE